MALTRATAFAAGLIALPVLAGCSPDYSPNTYNAAAVQQANKVEQGVVAGVREVGVVAAGTTGGVAGAAAGSVVGSQLPGSSATQALGAVGGGVLGGLLGTGVERATGDTKAYEYIVRKPNGDLVSVTQADKTPLALGQRVLVIAGTQARIVPDYTTAAPEKPKDAAKAVAAPAASGVTRPAASDTLTPAPVDVPATASPSSAAAPVSTPAAVPAPAAPPASAAVPAPSAAPSSGTAPTPLAPPAPTVPDASAPEAKPATAP